MSDLTRLLREVAERADASGMLVPHEIRRAGQRRRNRLVVTTAVCVVLAAVGAGLLIRGAPAMRGRPDPPARPDPKK